MSSLSSLSRKDWILLALLTFCWGINWPIMKMAVQDFPPIAFRTLCIMGAVPVLWLAARWSRTSLKVSQDDLGTIFTLAIPNIIIWNTFMIVGVKMLSSGRAAILGYTMPIWAVLSGLIFFRDRISRLGWLGIAFALSGALLLLSSEFANLRGQPLGSVMTLVAAAAWGYGTVLMKRTKIEIPTMALTFWMLLMASICMGITSALFEYQLWRLPTAKEAAAIAYNGLIIFGFAQVIWFSLARKLPPVASSLSVMMIPVLGVFSGAWWLNETPHWQDYVAMCLISAAMSTVLLKPRSSSIK
ncbi:MAG: DMT family transporter [Herminiimonas sp.]|uniref:DMT family transporter n=1 Tax=Herminiimonas sp. TaxID=1926289 RepID=UPI00271F7FA3|nr:DMT family transporter [Herminiimonas sp.]MDO9420467.1 DMT family transporter [Herminiimonas sp.]